MDRAGLDAEAVPMQTEGGPRVPVFMNGHGPFWFILDTGGVGCDISPRIIEALSLPVTDGAVPLRELRIGPLAWSDLRMGVGNTERIERVDRRPVDGLLGGAFMSWAKLAIQLDYPRSTFALWQSDRRLGAEAIPIEIRDYYPIVPVWVDGQGPHPFLLDTGSSICTVHPRLAECLNLSLIGPSRTRGVLGTNYAYESTLSSLRVGQVEARDLEVFVEDSPLVRRCVGDAIMGCIGYTFLRDSVVQLDYPEQRLALARGR